MQFVFDESRAAQAASVLLDRHGGEMPYIKLIKLLYLADRAALIETGMPITGDRFVSAKSGPVLSKVLALIEEPEPAKDSVWHSYVARKHFDARLAGKANADQLSAYELELLHEIAASHRAGGHSPLLRLLRAGGGDGGGAGRGDLHPAEARRRRPVNPGDTFLRIRQARSPLDGALGRGGRRLGGGGDFTTHDPDLRPTCGSDCLVVRPGDHPYPRHDSCIFFQGAMLTSNRALRMGVAEGVYDPRAPLTPALLDRVREGALASKLTAESIKTAIRQGLPR